jgi:hypothetical protein
MTLALPKPKRRNPLTDWLHSALSDPEKAHPCSALLLAYETRAGDEEVQTVKFQSGTQWRPEELADRLYSIACEHCKDDRGIEHRYKLFAFYGSDEPQNVKRFTLSPMGDELQFVGETPDARGAMQQGQRLLETMAQGTFRLLGQLVGSAAQETMHLRRALHEANEMTMTLMMKIADKDHERQIELLKFQRETEERQMWYSYAPLLINTILDREVFPQGTVDTKIVEAAAENLSVEDLQALSQKLPPHLWGPLAARLDKALKKKADAKEKGDRVLKLLASAQNELGEEEAG